MNIKKLITAGIMALAAFAAFADPTVTDVVAKQRYPWNGLVDITCKVTGINGTTNGLDFAVVALMPNSGEVRKASRIWLMKGGTKTNDLEVYTNGTHRLLWDAQADLGQVLYSNMVVRVTTVKGHGKVQLWKGGPYWATANIGAENPEDYGYYFWWGDTVGYKRENSKWVATDGGSSSSFGFSFSSYNTPTDDRGNDWLGNNGWVTYAEDYMILVPAHDAAHVQWGGSWRMPTYSELSGLKSKCDWTWTTMNGVNGYVVRGRGDYVSSCIFLPAAGWGNGNTLKSAGSGGGYWSSSGANSRFDNGRSSGGYPSVEISFTSDKHSVAGMISRWVGNVVRPVQGFTE